MSTRIVILGDFNIHIDNPSCHLAAEFLSLIDCLGLQQHVKAPTHTKGHTLDLVITDAPINNLEINDLGVSDHKLVSMAFSCMLPTIRPKRQISFRNWKQIDPTSIIVDLQHISCPVSATVDELATYYNIALSSVFDLHAPIRT